MEKTYELLNNELVKRFRNECIKIGAASFNARVNAEAPACVVEARYLEGVLLSRLEEKSPPFKPGEKVKPYKNKLFISLASYNGPQVEKGEIYTVNRAWYKDGVWFLTFNEFQDQNELNSQFPARNFYLVVPPETHSEAS